MTEHHDDHNEETLVDEIFTDPLLGVSLIHDSKETRLYSKHALLIPVDATHSSSLKLEKPLILVKEQVNAGNQVVLDINLGLFDKPLSHLLIKPNFFQFRLL